MPGRTEFCQVPIQLDVGYRESERMAYALFVQYGFGTAGDKWEGPCDAMSAATAPAGDATSSLSSTRRSKIPRSTHGSGLVFAGRCSCRAIPNGPFERRAGRRRATVAYRSAWSTSDQHYPQERTLAPPGSGGASAGSVTTTRRLVSCTGSSVPTVPKGTHDRTTLARVVPRPCRRNLRTRGESGHQRMSSSQPFILVVDDDPDIREAVREILDRKATPRWAPAMARMP